MKMEDNKISSDKKWDSEVHSFKNHMNGAYPILEENSPI